MIMVCGIGLDRMGYRSASSKFTVEKVSLKKWKYLSLGISMAALMLPPSDNKYIVFGTFAGDFLCMMVEAQLANFGIFPFWFYSYRHYIRFFDWISLGINFIALKNLRNRIDSHGHEFVN